MGGFGSGKGCRSPYRQRRRYYIDELKYLCRKTIDPKKLCPPDYSPGYFKGIALKMHPHHMRGGGIWYDFECPSCKRGARRLYASGNNIACRRCYRLAYRCENLGKTDRASAQRWKHLDKIGADGFCPPGRPKWMKRHVFSKIEQKIDKYNRLSYSLFLKYPCKDPEGVLKGMLKASIKKNTHPP